MKLEEIDREVYPALYDFHLGWRHGWDGVALDKKGSKTYKSAYGNAKKAREEQDFWDRKKESSDD